MGTARGLSYEQFLEQYEGVRAEWKEGEAVPMVACNYPHQRLVTFLSTLLNMGAQLQFRGELLVAPFQMKTGPDLPGREPDILWFREERRELLKSLYFDGAADLAIEVASPGSRLRDRGEKFAEYEMGGVREYWLLDPELERADFYILQNEGRFALQPLSDGLFRSAVLEGFQLPVAWLWTCPPVAGCLKELGWL